MHVFTTVTLPKPHESSMLYDFGGNTLMTEGPYVMKALK